MIDDNPFAVEQAGMQWTAVESSQISEIGYEGGAEYPLGIKFPPNKKQKAAGEPGSEYRYKNVSPELFAEFLAADSIGSFFGTRIKSRPDLYPYVKVEADPTHPAPTKKNGTEPPSLFTAAGGADVEAKGATDILSPGSALALIDSMADDLLFTPGAITDAQLAAGRQWYLTEAKKYDISTEPKRTELKRFARPLQKLRTGIEARAKELTGATKRKIAAIDAEKRRLVQIVGGIEDEVLRPLTEWESNEDARIEERNNALKAITEGPGYGATETVSELQDRLAWLESQLRRDWQEFAVPAQHAINEETARVEKLIELAETREREQSELARLRVESAARAERDRLDLVAKEAREQAEREAKAAVEYAEQKRLAAEQETKRQAELAEQRAIEAAAQAKRDQEQAIENERMRVAVEAKQEREAAEARAADDDHRCMVNKEAIDAIAKHLSVEWDLANTIVSAIAAGLIPHITITY
jgi:hypothetical protein